MHSPSDPSFRSFDALNIDRSLANIDKLTKAVNVIANVGHCKDKAACERGLEDLVKMAPILSSASRPHEITSMDPELFRIIEQAKQDYLSGDRSCIAITALPLPTKKDNTETLTQVHFRFTNASNHDNVLIVLTVAEVETVHTHEYSLSENKGAHRIHIKGVPVEIDAQNVIATGLLSAAVGIINKAINVITQPSQSDINEAEETIARLNPAIFNVPHV